MVWSHLDLSVPAHFQLHFKARIWRTEALKKVPPLMRWFPYFGLEVGLKETLNHTPPPFSPPPPQTQHRPDTQKKNTLYPFQLVYFLLEPPRQAVPCLWCSPIPKTNSMYAGKLSRNWCPLLFNIGSHKRPNKHCYFDTDPDIICLRLCHNKFSQNRAITH